MNNKLFLLLLLISLTAFGFAGFYVIQRLTPIPRPTVTSQPQSASISATLAISIPDINLSNIPVYPASLVGTEWEYSTIGISHLSSTVWAGEKGNAVYYGHNWPNLLGNLHQLKVGQPIVITNPTGTKKTFKVVQINIVSPDQVQVIAPSDDARLTLFTCTGFFDSQRLVVIAR